MVAARSRPVVRTPSRHQRVQRSGRRSSRLTVAARPAAGSGSGPRDARHIGRARDLGGERVVFRGPAASRRPGPRKDNGFVSVVGKKLSESGRSLDAAAADRRKVIREEQNSSHGPIIGRRRISSTRQFVQSCRPGLGRSIERWYNECVTASITARTRNWAMTSETVRRWRERRYQRFVELCRVQPARAYPRRRSRLGRGPGAFQRDERDRRPRPQPARQRVDPVAERHGSGRRRDRIAVRRQGVPARILELCHRAHSEGSSGEVRK